MARLRRRQMGHAGFSLIDMLFVIALVGLLSTFAIPVLMRARGAAQASSALATLRVMNSAQLGYAITCGLGFYAPDLPTLGVAPPGSSEAFLPPELTTAASIIRFSYSFSMVGTPLFGAPATCNGLPPNSSAPGYAVVADPLNPAENPRFFATNADGTVYEHDRSLAAAMPESGEPGVGIPIK